MLPGIDVSGLQVGGIHPATSTLLRSCGVLLSVNEGDQTRNLGISKVEARHALVRASIAHNGADFVSTDIVGYQFGPREIRSTLSAACIAAVAKRAVLPEEGPSTLNQFWRIRFGGT